jgi:hypothetical protein
MKNYILISDAQQLFKESVASLNHIKKPIVLEKK